MPMLYGEGRRAFFRLQEEIIKRAKDHSFLLWTQLPKKQQHARIIEFPAFAFGPACFPRDGIFIEGGVCLDYQEVRPGSLVAEVPARFSELDPPQMTSRGLRISLPCRSVIPRSTTSSEGRFPLLWTGLICSGRAVRIAVRMAMVTSAELLHSGRPR
jgi:hypothetical protein